jgi:hypothetical protein
MKQPTKKTGKSILARIKVWLMSGRKINGPQANEMYDTQRLPAYIHELEDEIPIDRKRVKIKGRSFTEYWMKKPKKENRILTRQYSR